VRALGADHGLGVVGLAVFVRVGARHQRAVGIGEVGLSPRRRIVLGRLGRAAGPALLRVAGGAPGLGFGAGLLLQPGAGGVELGPQRKRRFQALVVAA
jgi:hypothetical protein